MSKTAGERAVERREAEIAIVKATIKIMLDAGFALTVDDGGDYPIKMSREADETFSAMMSVDDEHLLILDATSGRTLGWVYFVYGNDGFDVISDHTSCLTKRLSPITALADRLEREMGA